MPTLNLSSQSFLLELDHLQLKFGGISAVSDVSFDVRPGEVVGLIGPNGAGKTSVFNCITGHYRPSSGNIKVAGGPITGRPPYEISRLGVRRTFQNIRLFPSLSVLANIAVGAHMIEQSDDELDNAVNTICGQLKISGETMFRPAGELPYGAQRRIELARALIGNPRVLLVDEPGAGLNPLEKHAIVELLRYETKERKCAVVLIEHDLGMIARACDRVVVLDHGAVISSGTPDEVRSDPAVVAAYIGT